MVLISKLVKAHEKLVKRAHKIVGAHLVRKFRETHNVGVNNRYVVVPLYVDLVELLFWLFSG